MKDGEVFGFTPDSRQVVHPYAVDDQPVDAGSPGARTVVVILGKGASAGAAAVTPDGTRIITAGNDGCLDGVGRPDGSSEIRTYGKQPDVLRLAVSPDGRLVAVASWATVGVWDCATGRRSSN